MVARFHAIPGPLGDYVAGFAEELARLGYAEQSARQHLDLLRDLSVWLAEEKIDPGALNVDETTRFLQRRGRRGHHRLTTLVGARPLLDYLIGLGVVPVRVAPVPADPGGVLYRYRQYLIGQRGLSDAEVTRHGTVARLFIESLGDLDWTAVAAGDVTQFVVRQCSTLGRPAACKLVSELRSFLRFVHVDGLTTVALWQAVPPVAVWSASSLPRWVAPEVVAAMLVSCDRRTRSGRRDLAILVLLARLGLRPGEVAGMRLEGHRLACRRDRGAWQGAPRRAAAVARGHRRGHRGLPATRQARHQQPVGVPTAASAVAGPDDARRIRGCARAASVRAGQAPIGAHRLRHSAATAMLRSGASLSEVGQVLRQRTAATTAIYAKVDHDSLRALARPWPGGAVSATSTPPGGLPARPSVSWTQAGGGRITCCAGSSPFSMMPTRPA